MTDIELQLRVQELAQLTDGHAQTAALLLIADALERAVAELAELRAGLIDLGLESLSSGAPE